MRDGRMLVTMQRQLHLVDPATGQYTVLSDRVGGFTLGGKDTVVLSREDFDGTPSMASVHDLEAGTRIPLASHGSGVVALALDATSTIAVTGSRDGIVRVGPVSGSTPRWLVGHSGRVVTVAVSADGRFIASGGSDGTIRLWPMPDLSRPPLHDLPRAELVARLRSLTNLRVVRDPEDPDGYLVQAGPFPGWQTVPEW
jgi:WD40 repeat protein